MNTSRIKNRNRRDIEFMDHGSIPDLLDNHMKAVLRINDDEYDFICEKASDDEIEILCVQENITFQEKRKIIIVLTKYLKLYNESPKEPRKKPIPPTKEELEAHRKCIEDNPDGLLAFLDDKKKMEKMGSMGEDTTWFFNKWNPEGKIPEGLKDIPYKE